MRTTLTLEDDVARLVEEAVHRERRSMKDVVNDALRRALGPGQQTAPYRMPVHHSQIRPGIDPARLNQFLDEVDDDDVAAAATRP